MKILASSHALAFLQKIRTPEFKRWAKRLLFAFFLYAVLMALAAPFAIKYFASKFLSEKLERPVEIGSLQINPINLSVQINNFRIGSDTAPDLKFEQLRVNLESSSLMRMAPVLSEITLTRPFINLIHMGEGAYNWTDIAKRLSSPEKPEPPNSTPARFSLHNIQIKGGEIRFEDRPIKQTHTLTDIELGLPHLSNIPSQIEGFVPLALGMKLDGSPLLIDGKSRPFAEERNTSLSLDLGALDLTRYLSYLPFKPHFVLESGKLGGRIKLDYAAAKQEQPQSLLLSGQFKLEDFKLKDLSMQPAIALSSLDIDLRQFDLAQNTLQLGKVALVAPDLNIKRDTQGQLNLLSLFPASPPSPAETPSEKPNKASISPEFKFDIEHISLAQGRLQYQDTPDGQTFSTQFKDIAFDIKNLSNHAKTPAKIDLNIGNETGQILKSTAEMVLKPFSLTGELNLTGAPVAHYAPYYSKALPGANIESGLLSANAQYTLVVPDDAPLHLELKAPTLLLEQFALRDLQEKQPFVQIERLGLNELSLQLAQHQLHIGQIHSQGAKFSLATDEKGGLTALRILKSPDNHPAQTHAKPSNTKAEAPSAPWTWQIQNVDFSKWALKFEERSSGKPVQLALDDWALHLEGLSSKTEAPLKLNTQAQFNKTGRIQTEGTVRLEPILKTQLKLDTTNIDLSPFRPYADKAMRMAITKGKLNARSHIDLAFEKTGLKGHVSGDFGVIGFASRDTINDADFVQWQQLSLENLNLTLSPLAINLEEVKLNGLVSRLILSEKGRLNLRELPAQEDSPPPDAATPAPTQDNKAASTPPTDKPSAPKLALKVNKISLNDANIIYSDRFIKPNFDVDVRQFSGQLTGLESLPDKIAKLNFGGRVDGSAPLKLEGEFNPFRDDLKLDIRASVQDYELTGISAYTGKYVGYGIQKGKLSADLGYKIEDRKLRAANKIKLNQLTFGDAVQSPDAMNLPVQLAVTLLADRNGVIDLSLPVTGALDDPQFSIAGVVWQAFTNIISKALTAPFTLLGNIFSGGGEDSAPILNFAPGAETLASTESEKLEKLAQALKDRPSLKVEITGIAHSTEDLNGLRTRWLNDKMQHFYTQELQDKGMNAEEAEKQTFPENEKSRLLKRVYRDADFKKPRSLIGLTKDIPPDEMEKLIINNAPVKEENLHNLAKARAQVVKEQLDKAGVSGEQLFLTEPKVEPSSSTDAGRVQFALKK